jgi:4-hydroxy-4-methyl-2-oxoglutarate aldolase
MAESKLSDVQVIQQLRKFDTATICNVVATYPESDICLKLYDAWRGEYYTDTSVRCLYPELGPVCGYAATAWYSDERPEHTKLDPWTLYDHFDRINRPIIFVAKQAFAPGLENLAALFGGNTTTQFKAFGVQGVLTDGPVRDYVEMKGMNMQYLATGFTSGHGPSQLRGAGTPVKIAGMTVSPGDIVHMDQCGACKFPADKLQDVLRFATELLVREAKERKRFQDPGFTLQRWKAERKSEPQKKATEKK